QTVDEAVVQDRTRLPVFHADIPPDLADGELIALFRQLDDDGAGAIARGKEYPLIADHNRLRCASVMTRRPRKFPQYFTAIGTQSDQPVSADDQVLRNTKQRCSHR